jgi:hypothetical protein
MSGYSTHDEFELEERRGGDRWFRVAAKGLGVAFWGLVSFGLTFVELLAEIAAPLVLMLGALWWAVLKVIDALPVPPEMQPMVAAFPVRLVAAGYVLTPGGMIIQGLWLVAVVAACRTLNGIIFKQT